MKHICLLLIMALCYSTSVFSQTTYDFESAETSLYLQYFGSSLEPNLTTIIDNPDASGINTSAKVGHYIKAAGAQVWAGGFANPAPDEPIDATNGGTVCVKVWMDHVGNLALKLEGDAGGGENWITTQPYTTPNQWQELCFDLTAPSLEDSNQPATGKVFNQIVLFFDFLVASGPANVDYYFDDIVIPTDSDTDLTTTILDFESPETTGEFTYFGSTLDGQKTLIISNPNPTGVNTSATVGSFTKPAVAQTWAGAYSNPNPITPVDATTNQKICIKVHMDHIGNIAIKLEGSTSGEPNWIDSMSNTKINEWEEICFDLKSPSFEAPFTPASGVYQTIVLFFDFGNPGTGSDVLYYFDDIVTKSGIVQEDKVINFKVNMNNYSSNFDVVYLSGSFNSWSGDSNPLNDDDFDGIWEGSITVPNGLYEYKISLDNWSKEEIFIGTEECTKTTGEFTNRLLLVSANTAVPEFCFNSCYACGDEVKINFRLGMGSVPPSPDGVWLAGGGNFEVPGGKYRMKDENQDGIYELTVPRKKGFSSFFTFANGPCGDYSCKEDLTDLPCGDPNNFNDRFLGPVNSDIVFATCFGLCTTNAECTSSVKDLKVNKSLFTVTNNPSFSGHFGIIFNENNEFDKQLTISNNVGQIIRVQRIDSNSSTTNLDITDLQSGIYYISVNTRSHTLTQKIIKL
jgi:hypothetical protein